MLLFGMVGAFGMIVNMAMLYILTAFAGLHYIIASAIATETAILCNFLNNHFITFRDKRAGSTLRKLLNFQLISLTTIAGTAGILFLLTE